MLILENATVWSGEINEKPSLKTIIINNKTIERVAEANEPIKANQDDLRVDLSGRFVMPGLINSHTHICLDGSADIKTKDLTFVAVTAAKAAEKTIHTGVTTIRDLGAPAKIDIILRDMINQGLIDGPEMVVSGNCLCMTGGHGHDFGMEIDGPHEARKGARFQLKMGADLIKVMATGGVLTKGCEPGSPQLTVDEMRAIVEEAEKAGTVVSAHAHGTQGIINAVTAGVKNIEHGTLLDEKGANLMAENNAYYTPTFISAQKIFENGVKQGIPDSVRKVKSMMKPRAKSLKLARKKGLKILIGSDAGTLANPHGMESLLGNMLLLQEQGMSTLEILSGATQYNAQALGLEEKIGKLAPGYQADIIALANDPFLDLKTLGQVNLVIKKGKVIHNDNS